MADRPYVCRQRNDQQTERSHLGFPKLIGTADPPLCGSPILHPSQDRQLFFSYVIFVYGLTTLKIEHLKPFARHSMRPEHRRRISEQSPLPSRLARMTLATR